MDLILGHVHHIGERERLLFFVLGFLSLRFALCLHLRYSIFEAFSLLLILFLDLFHFARVLLLHCRYQLLRVLQFFPSYAVLLPLILPFFFLLLFLLLFSSFHEIAVLRI